MSRKEYYRDNIKYLRHLYKMTQEELGQKVGKKSSTVTKWENGIIEPPMSVIWQIANVFNVDEFNMLFVDLSSYNGDFSKRVTKKYIEEKRFESEQETTLIELFSQLNAERKAKVLEFVEGLVFIEHNKKE